MQPNDKQRELDEIKAYNTAVVEKSREILEYLDAQVKSGQSYVYNPPRVVSFPSDIFAGFARKFKRCIRPMHYDGPALVRIGSAHDGGYVMPDPGKKGLAYSLGISDNVDWDLEMAERGFAIFQYDASVDAPPVEHRLFRFHKYFVSGQDTGKPSYKTLNAILAENNHQSAADIIFKMDIEGAEWDVLESLSRSTLLQFKQIVMELHFSAADVPLLPVRTALLERLNRTHQCVHMHVNNSMPGVDFNGEPFWYIWEVSYIRRDSFNFTPSLASYPTPLDTPCIEELPEVIFGKFEWD